MKDKTRETKRGPVRLVPRSAHPAFNLRRMAAWRAGDPFSWRRGGKSHFRTESVGEFPPRSLALRRSSPSGQIGLPFCALFLSG